MERKPKTILDLNMYVLDEIFKKLKSDVDKINLAKAHPYLTAAFEYHGRLAYRQIVTSGSVGTLSFIIKYCGQYVKLLKILIFINKEILQLIIENCPNVSSIEAFLNGKHGKSEFVYPTYLFTRNEVILDIEVLYKLARNLKSLRRLELQRDDIDMEFIRTLLDILQANGVTPEDPLELVVLKFARNLKDSLLTEISTFANANLIKIKFIQFRKLSKLKPIK